MSLVQFPAPSATPPDRSGRSAQIRHELRAALARSDAALPRAPQTVEDTGLPMGFLVELVGKQMVQFGANRLTELAGLLKLPGVVLEQVCAFMRTEGLLEIARRGQHEADVQYDLTMGGRARAGEWLARNGYVGPAPVTLLDYTARVQQQSVTRQSLTAEQVAEAFADLIVPEGLADALGTAMNSARPMMLYGPAGSGKTYLAERLSRLLGGPVAVPHALMIHGEVVRIHDAHWHRPAADNIDRGPWTLDSRQRADERWVLCERPVVMSGGELTLEMLDLSFDPRAGYYEAPPHVKANNGIYIVDDLGRQIVSPQALMNRWIVPMERRHDYLMLRNGGKFQVPFDLVLVFSSNLKPADLADGAFLRRIGHKIAVGPLSPRQYQQVFQQTCEQLGVPYEPLAFVELLARHHEPEDRPLMACYPRDLLQLVCSRAAYLGVPPTLDRDLYAWAWQTYFANDPKTPTAAPALIDEPHGAGSAGTGVAT